MAHGSPSASALLPGDEARLQRNAGCLVLRLPGNPDQQRIDALLTVMLKRVTRQTHRAVILDFTETRLLDSNIAEQIETAARQSAVLGTPVLLCELQPALSAALVDLGHHLPSVIKVGSIDQALESNRTALGRGTA